jgi:hypothetical protein
MLNDSTAQRVENWLAHEPEEKNIPSFDGIRVSAGQQHIASVIWVKRKYALSA